MLFLTLCLQVGYNSASKKLSVDVGGAKRLHALSTLIQAMILGPWAMIFSSSTESQVNKFTSTYLYRDRKLRVESKINFLFTIYIY